MSYPMNLEDYSEVELEAEIERRRNLRARGRCDYCRRDVASSNPCGQPSRHRMDTRREVAKR